jgi:hypothetical protein
LIDSGLGIPEAFNSRSRMVDKLKSFCGMEEGERESYVWGGRCEYSNRRRGAPEVVQAARNEPFPWFLARGTFCQQNQELVTLPVL